MTEVMFSDQVAIITGAARGLGRCYALDLAGRGAAVVVNDLAGRGADGVVASITEAGGRAIAAEHDISDPEGAQQVVADALAAYGRLDVLVNNAGMLRNGRFDELSADRIRDIFAVHLAGAFFVTQPAFRAMREAGYGRIVNISSNTSFGMAGLVNYAAAKAGVLGFTTSLAIEGRPHGIGVNSVMPNGATTIMDDEPIPGFEEDTQFASAFEGVAHHFEPERTAALVTFLASSKCMASGQHFSSLGGRYARVFYGVTEGWLGPDSIATAEAVGDHFSEISDLERVELLPTSIGDEFHAVSEALAGRTPA
jgi:NAD(P)-dependent dehydrogenase (short-subunit alcohol dehydrogenase family)